MIRTPFLLTALLKREISCLKSASEDKRKENKLPVFMPAKVGAQNLMIWSSDIVVLLSVSRC
jgi:hypothetical protein